jgi:DNA-binding beta-propeller fold protein YncE
MSASVPRLMTILHDVSDGSSAVRTLTGTLCGSTDGGATVASFAYPFAIALNPSGTKLYVADNNSQKVRVVDCSTGCTHFWQDLCLTFFLSL